MKFYIPFLTLLLACSFQPDSKNKYNPPQGEKATPAQSSNLDSDGDGETDSEEEKAGSDKFVADIPSFEGGLFDEMKLKVDLYNKSDRSTVSFEINIKDNKIRNSWEEIEQNSSQGGIYMESLLKSYATANSFKKNNFKFYDYNDGILSYSSPILYEDSLYLISKELLKYYRSGFELIRATAIIGNKFRINSKKHISYRNPVFDVYYKSKDREGLIFIESKKIDGTYNFNDENKINLHFESFDPKIINEAFLSGGSSFFLKLRDFTIYETNQTYSSILEKVTSVTVPITISTPLGDDFEKSKSETIYVGINPKGENLKSILKKRFKDTVLMTDSSIDKISELSNRQRSFGETGENEILKWIIGVSQISDNVYSYQFRHNEGIGLAYLSDKKTEKMPIYVSRTTLSNGIVSTSGTLPLETNNIKIKVMSQKILTPFERITREVRGDCGRGDWDRNEVTYDLISLDYTNDTSRIHEFLLRDGQITINSSQGAAIQDNIGNLVKSGLLIATKGSTDTELELTISPKLGSELFKTRSQISIGLILTPPSFSIREGARIKIGANCRRMRSESTRGTEVGGRAGGFVDSNQTDSSYKNNSGFGFSGNGFETEYDLDIHVFSY